MLFKNKSERTSQRALIDIQENILLSQKFVESLVFKEKVYAVIRCLEIISEASRRLSDIIRGRHPHIMWNGVAAAGNVYRHEYDRLHDREIWNTMQVDLPPLLSAVEEELRRLASGTLP